MLLPQRIARERRCQESANPADNNSSQQGDTNNFVMKTSRYQPRHPPAQRVLRCYLAACGRGTESGKGNDCAGPESACVTSKPTFLHLSKAASRWDRGYRDSNWRVAEGGTCLKRREWSQSTCALRRGRMMQRDGLCAEGDVCGLSKVLNGVARGRWGDDMDSSRRVPPVTKGTGRTS